ncbi:transposase [Prosthecomicrobium hirschii]|uniref:Transposase n=1 Tax=Prosthecodimorpha hirschii TaxID=665126 RepID=A0A0P6VIH3_9HYPH|nr:transposase [Prosthecomicrobium hirschii]
MPDDLARAHAARIHRDDLLVETRETLARAMTIIETAKMNGIDLQAYLADVLDRIHDHKINRLDELLPWNWAPAVRDRAAAA